MIQMIVTEKAAPFGVGMYAVKIAGADAVAADTALTQTVKIKRRFQTDHSGAIPVKKMRYGVVLVHQTFGIAKLVPKTAFIQRLYSLFHATV